MKAKTEDPSFDVEALAAEIKEGMDCWCDLPTTKTHLLALVVAARCTLLHYPAESDLLNAALLDFVAWCRDHADFGPQMRKVVGEDLWRRAEERCQ